MKTFTLGSGTAFATLLFGCVALIGAGCNGSANIPNLTQSAAALPGNAVYVGPKMNVPRYGHTATSLEDGIVLVVGGTDERHLTAIDRVELFDQSARVDLSLPVPESISGDFIDQDIDGNLITLSNGGRIFHTADSIDDGNVLIIGGTDGKLFGLPNDTSEIYDPLTRSFSNPDFLIDQNDDIRNPRLRHSTRRLPNGKLLISGGQDFVIVQVPGPFGGFFPQNAYPSIRSLEIFDPATLQFTDAIDTSGEEAELTTSRGRSDHVTESWAGFDNLLGTGDDVIGFLGGFQTLSALSTLAPQDLISWSNLHTTLTSMDFYFASTGSVSLAQGMVIPERMDGQIAMNLGRDHQATPFGDFGVANAVLLFNGDSGDAGCPQGPAGSSENVDFADLIIGTYTGFGPANGARFTRFQDFGGIFGLEEINTCQATYNRSEADAVLMDMTLMAGNQAYIGSVIVTGGGYDQTLTPGGCVVTVDNSCFGQQEGFVMYQPFFDVEPYVPFHLGLVPDPPLELPWYAWSIPNVIA